MANLSTKMQSATNHGVGWQNYRPRCSRRQIAELDSEFVIWDATGDKIAEQDSEFVDRDAVGDKSRRKRVSKDGMSEEDLTR